MSAILTAQFRSLQCLAAMLEYREIELNCMSSLMVYKQLLQYVGHVGITGLGQLSLASFRGR